MSTDAGVAVPVAAAMGKWEVSRPRPPWVHFAWFGGGTLVAFLIPYLLTSVAGLQHDVYYLIYFATVLSFLYIYVRLTHVDVWAVFARNWRWSLALGAAATVFVVANVLSRDSTDGPSGGYLAFELAWRGVAYGVVDALLLTAFPGLVVVGLMRGRISGLLRRVEFAALALVLVMIITGTLPPGLRPVPRGRHRSSRDGQYHHVRPHAGDAEPRRLHPGPRVDARRRGGPLTRDGRVPAAAGGFRLT